MVPEVLAYQHGIYPRSETVVAATRGLERGRTSPEEVALAYAGDLPEPKMATLPSPFLFSRAASSDEDRDALMMTLTREVLRPISAGLAARGYRLIHLQEPWLVYFGIEGSGWDDFAKALQE